MPILQWSGRRSYLTVIYQELQKKTGKSGVFLTFLVSDRTPYSFSMEASMLMISSLVAWLLSFHQRKSYFHGEREVILLAPILDLGRTPTVTCSEIFIRASLAWLPVSLLKRNLCCESGSRTIRRVKQFFGKSCQRVWSPGIYWPVRPKVWSYSKSELFSRG